jgi:hypothetical protein
LGLTERTDAASSDTFDTYATSQNGRIMHFDVILPEKDAAAALFRAREWLSIEHASLSQERYCYCHREAQAPADIDKEIAERSYDIYRMEGLPAPPGLTAPRGFRSLTQARLPLSPETFSPPHDDG